MILFHRSKGVAMLTALLVMTIATVTAVAMSRHQKIDIQQTENILRLDQAWEHIFSLEAWAKFTLLDDVKQNDHDSFSDVWAEEKERISVEFGSVSHTIVDLQGRFNLNNLYLKGKMADQEVLACQRLLLYLQLDPVLVYSILDRIESIQGQNRSAGVATNRYFTRVGELQVIRGMDANTYRQLAPHVSALPSGSRLNINTATKAVLMSLTESMTEGDINSIIQDRKAKPFSKVKDITEHPVMLENAVDTARLTVSSDYFMVNSDVRMGQLILRYESIFLRDKTSIVLVQRQRKGLFDE